MSISTFQYQQMLERTNSARGKFGQPTHIEVSSGCVTLESDLHDEIEKYCRQQGWPIVHSRMDRETTAAKGVPDFVIAASGGRTFWIEAKSATGKPTTEQLGFKLMLEMNGHQWHLVRSMAELLEIVNRKVVIPQ